MINKLKKVANIRVDVNELEKYLIKFCDKYQINTDNRINMFLAQLAHESGNFVFRTENLNYSDTGLRTVFGKYFTEATAKQYARKPEQIANIVYANRMGNKEAGDGWKFRGRGYIQLTGKDNYTRFANSIGKSVDETIKYLETTEGCVESACWFWFVNNLNILADKCDMVACTKKINGGTNGLAHRTKMYELLK